MADGAPELLSSFLNLAARLHDAAAEFYERAQVPLTSDGPRTPKALVMTLLVRTLGHGRAVVLLIQQGQVVEARVITRCAYENLFYAAALAKKGNDFIRDLELDHITTKRKRVSRLIDWLETQPERSASYDRVRSVQDDLRSQGKASEIKMREAAKDGGIEEGISLYWELSTDAAHPSAESLSRHISVTEVDGRTRPALHAEPIVAPYEAAETVGLLCSTLLGMLVAVKEVFADKPLDAVVEDFFQEFRALDGQLASHSAAR